MRRITSRICTLAAATLLAVTVGQAGPAGAASDAAYFNLRDVTGHNFVVEITRPALIQEARDIVRNGDRKVVIGRIIKTQARYNPQWDFHYNPDTASFADAAIEVCDATVPYVEDHLDEAGGAFLPGLYWCPWTGRLTAELSAP
ncbi:calmodulin-binding protein [Streptomyces sp. NPDC005732]|uniref:BP74-related protein n=1 Tax=Streptomyces sp. NPDC005732 TaxID=3157057 RepID=UPI0033FD9219